MDPNQIDLIIPMDWYTWLSDSAALSPSLATEYALLFSSNELEESDIPHLDHELLQSMGISIAKHRLEILKLARRRPAPLLAAIRNSKRRLASYIHSLADHRPHSSCSSAIVAVPSGEGGPRWSRRRTGGKHCVEMLKHAGRLMLTAGGSVKPGPRSHCEGGGDVKGGKEVVRWNSMFKDMKPT